MSQARSRLTPAHRVKIIPVTSSAKIGPPWPPSTPRLQGGLAHVRLNYFVSRADRLNSLSVSTTHDNEEVAEIYSVLEPVRAGASAQPTYTPPHLTKHGSAD